MAPDVFLLTERTRSSSWRELRAVRCVLAAFTLKISGLAVDVQVDSLCSAIIHAKGGSLRRDDASGRMLLQVELLAIEDLCFKVRVGSSIRLRMTSPKSLTSIIIRLVSPSFGFLRTVVGLGSVPWPTRVFCIVF